MRLKIKADLHTHSVGSGHAYSTIEELARAARKKSIKMLAIADHGPGMPGGPHEYFFYNMRILPDYLHGVRILKGVEANIISKEGKLDIGEDLLGIFDIVIASAHIVVTPENLTRKQNTQMYLKVMANKHVNILGHIENPQFDLNYKEVIGAAKETGKIIEINNASFTVTRKGSYTQSLEIMKLLKENDMPTVINSDAHIATRVGEVTKALEAALTVGIKKENILNFDYKRTAEYFKIAL